MIHVDVTKFGNVPDGNVLDGGVWRYVGKQQGYTNRAATWPATGLPAASTADRCYAPDTFTPSSATTLAWPTPDLWRRDLRRWKADTAIGVLRRASAWFAEREVIVERVLSDNGSAYRSRAWREACAELGITHKRTRPYRPQANGKIERFHRTLSDGWAYARLYDSEARRRAASLAALLQSPPSPQRHRSPTADQPPDQPPWASRLVSRFVGAGDRAQDATPVGDRHTLLDRRGSDRGQVLLGGDPTAAAGSAGTAVRRLASGLEVGL